MSDLRDQRVVRVRVCEQRTDGQEYLRYGQSRAPLFLENVKANAAVAIDIRVKNLGAERDLRWFERIIRWEMNVHQEYPTSKWTVRGPHDSGLPMEHVLTHRTCAAGGGRVLLQVLQLLEDPLGRHRSNPIGEGELGVG